MPGCCGMAMIQMIYFDNYLLFYKMIDRDEREAFILVGITILISVIIIIIVLICYGCACHVGL